MPPRCHLDVCNPQWIAGWVDDDGPVDSIEIAVDGQRIATVSPTDYRKDLEDAGFGDGRRSFSLAISGYLDPAEPLKVVTISRGKRVLHSQVLPPPTTEAKIGRILRATGILSSQANDILFLQTADPDKYRPLLDITSRTVAEYCRRHALSYQSFLGICRGFHSWQATFNRIVLLRRIVNSGFGGWICYLDADSFIADLDFDLPGFLSDKSHIALIAATDRPHEPERPYWAINAGVFLLNLGSRVGRKIVWDWAEQLDAISDERLQAMSEWASDDQVMLQRILQNLSGGPDVVLTLRGEPNLINYQAGLFIRQILRGHAELQERIDLLRSETDRVLQL